MPIHATASFAIGVLVLLSARPAYSIGRTARVKYGTSVYGGGPANPCGDDVDPGVTREGEAEAAFKLNNSVKLTYSMRTHYDPGVATAIDTARRLGYDAPATCSVAWAAKGQAPVDVLYFLWCGSGQRSAWCDTINQIPPAERSQGLSGFVTTGLLPDVNSACRANGPFRSFGWDKIGAKIAVHRLLFGNGPVYMNTVGFGAGLDGALKDGPDPTPTAYGRTLTPAQLDLWTLTWQAYGALFNQQFGGRKGYPVFDLTRLDRFVIQLTFIWAGSRLQLNGKYSDAAVRDLYAALCNTGPWIADTLDPGYAVSRGGLDQTFRDLSGLLDNGTPYDKPCQDAPQSCKPFNFADFYGAFWDAGPGAFGLPKGCEKRHHRPAVRDTLRQTGACKINM